MKTFKGLKMQSNNNDFEYLADRFIEKITPKRDEIYSKFRESLNAAALRVSNELRWSEDLKLRIENSIISLVDEYVKKHIKPLTENMDFFEVLQKNQKILEEQNKAIKELISKNEKLSERLVMIYMKNNGTIESIDKLLDTNK